MKAFFGYPPILVLGEMLVLPIEQNGQKAVRDKSGAQSNHKIASLSGHDKDGDESERPEI